MAVLIGCGSHSVTPTSGGPFRNDYDAVTMLASESAALLVRVTQPGPGGHDGSAQLSIEKTLQSNYNHVAMYPDPPQVEDIAFRGLPADEGFKSGHQYILFISYNRGGDCMAAAWTYNGPQSDLHLLTKTTHFGPDAPHGYRLGNRFLSMPTTIGYEDLVRRLYPTGGELDPSNTAEWFCPGP